MKTKFFSFLFVFLSLGLWQTSVNAQTMIDDMVQISPCAFDSAVVYDTAGKTCSLQEGVLATGNTPFQYNYYIFKVTNFEAKEYSINIKCKGGTSVTTCNVDFFDSMDSACAVDNTKGMILGHYPLLKVNTANSKVINNGSFTEYQWVHSFTEARQTKYMRIYMPMGVYPWYHTFTIGAIRFEIFNPKNQLKAKMDEVVTTRALLDNSVVDLYKAPLVTAYNSSLALFNDVSYDNIQGQPDKQAFVLASRDTLDLYLTKYKSHIVFAPDPTKDYVLVRKDSSYLYAEAATTSFYLNKPSNLSFTSLTDNDYAHFTIQKGTDGRFTFLNIGSGLYIGASAAQSATAITGLISFMASKVDASGKTNFYFSIYNLAGDNYLDAGGSGWDYKVNKPSSVDGKGNKVGLYYPGIPTNDKCWFYFVPVEKKAGVLKGGLKAVLDAANIYTTESGLLVENGLATTANEDLIYNAISAGQAVYDADPAGQVQADIDAARDAVTNAIATFKTTIKFTPKADKVYSLTTPNNLTFAQSSTYNKAGVTTAYGYQGMVVLTDNNADSLRWIIKEGPTAGTYSLRNKASLKYMNSAVKMDSVPFYFPLVYVKILNSSKAYFAGKGMSGGQNFDVDGSGLLENNKVSYWGTTAIPEDKNLLSLLEFTPTVANPVDISAVPTLSASDNIKVFSVNQNLLIKGAEGLTATVYSLDGRINKQLTLKNNLTALPLSSGFYIVRVGDKVAKVIVK